MNEPSKLARVTIGSDPELFLFSKKESRYKSSVGLIGGTKAHPIPLGDRPEFFVQEDNVTVEFNTAPVTELEDFVAGINYSVQTIKGIADKLGLEVRADASAIFSGDELLSEGARTFGCEPDFNAWTGKMNMKPNAGNEFLRSCGGHIHVGVTDLERDHLIRMMDLYLGVPSVIMDLDTDRKKLYGKAGACRLKHYGVEYRVLSNFWLKSEDLVRWAFIETLRSVQAARTNLVNLKLEGEAIQTCINTCDMELAHDLAARHNLRVV